MITLDTNIVFYALAGADFSEQRKVDRAQVVLSEANFLSVQVLNEYAASVRRKLRRDWAEIEHDTKLLRATVSEICPIVSATNFDALRLVKHYQLGFYDGLMLAVALAHHAETFYSEDMQHGMVIDKKLTIINPFLEPDAL